MVNMNETKPNWIADLEMLRDIDSGVFAGFDENEHTGFLVEQGYIEETGSSRILDYSNGKITDTGKKVFTYKLTTKGSKALRQAIENDVILPRHLGRGNVLF